MKNAVLLFKLFLTSCFLELLKNLKYSAWESNFEYDPWPIYVQMHNVI